VYEKNWATFAKIVASSGGKTVHVCIVLHNQQTKNIFTKSMTAVGWAMGINVDYNKKAQLSLRNPRDACEKSARFT